MSKRRQVSVEPDDFVGQFQNSDSIKSKRSLKTLNHMKENEAAKISDVHDDPVFSTGAEMDRVLLEYVIPQPDNSRYFPAKSSLDQSEAAIEKLKDCVVCEKGIIENRLSKSNVNYSEVDLEIEKIKELAASLKENDLIHPITIWRANTTNYPIVTGHRRYYALKFLYGTNVKVKCKIYPSKPKNVSTLRHIENFQRKSLAPAEALDSFSKALSEISDSLTDLARSKRNALICSKLGMSEGKRFSYEKLVPHFEKVQQMFRRKIFTSIESASKYITTVERASTGDKNAFVNKYLSICLKKGELLDPDNLEGDAEGEVKIEKAKPSLRAKKYIKLPKIKVSQPEVVRRILTEDVTKLDIGVDWSEVDYKDPEQLENVLERLIALLSKQ